MSVKISAKLARLIDEAGELQRTAAAAKADYDDCRNRLRKALDAELGADQWGEAAKFKAGLIHDHFEKINPVRFIARVKNKQYWADVLKVNVTKAKAVLSPGIYNDLVEAGVAEEVKLYVRELKVSELRAVAAVGGD